MKSPQRGEVWLVDLGMAAKVRSHKIDPPCRRDDPVERKIRRGAAELGLVGEAT